MVVYTKPQQRKKEESERLRGVGDQIISAYVQCLSVVVWRSG